MISEAWAQTASSSPESGLLGMLPIILMFVVLWFIMIRPQMKRAKEHKKLLEELQKGDEVVAAGGILGRIVKLDENNVTLQIAPSVEIQVQRPAIGTVLPKGTLKNS
jgi:preprotein translocase subunit YajC